MGCCLTAGSFELPSCPSAASSSAAGATASALCVRAGSGFALAGGGTRVAAHLNTKRESDREREGGREGERERERKREREREREDTTHQDQ